MTARITRNFARYIALPAVSAGILGGAALGLAGMANASTTQDVRPPAVVATPNTIARPPVVVIPRHRWHHDRGLIIDFPGGK
jgi:hypothetical protein